MSPDIDCETFRLAPASQEKEMAQTATPATTAYAMLAKTESNVTKRTTRASTRGTFRCKFSFSLRNLGSKAAANMPSENHLKVWSTTTSMMPESAATGMKLSAGYAPITATMTTRAAQQGAKRPRPPFRTFIVERPIIAFPPMPPKKPEITLPKPIAKTVRSPLLGVLTKDSTTSDVISDSMVFTVQSRKPCTAIALTLFHDMILLRSYPWEGRKKGTGKAVSDVNLLTSPMVSVLDPNGRTAANSISTATRMAISEEGITLKIFSGIFGRNSMVTIDTIMIRSIHHSSAPDL
mmetsp:Transcript_40213/g.65018  ORF Transcript_40213/g.65018 Transcript_40213/m.65018 type:complete len:293 (-) Transcript_40213:734-1612(-)